MAFLDYYAILGIPVGATVDQIERAYKLLAARLHPDVVAKDEWAQSWANERMKQINEAYEVLGDPAKRSAYDRTYSERKVGHGRADPDQRQQQREQRRETRVPCPTCGQSGRIRCLVCQGNGDDNCPGCQGQRIIVCPLCLGVGMLTETRYREHAAEEQRAREQARAQAAKQETEARRRREEQEAVRVAQAERARRFAGAVLGVFMLLLFGRSCLSSISAPSLATAPLVDEEPAPPAGPSPVAAQVEAVLTSWIDTLRNGDLDAHMGYYASNLERYFQKRHVSWRSVYAEKRAFLNKYPKLVVYRISNLHTDSVAQGVVMSVFEKTWDFRTRDNERFAGEERQRLKLRNFGGLWRIISEEELKIYWVVTPARRGTPKPSGPLPTIPPPPEVPLIPAPP
jgi:curved DNA-binding protein CbpA